jgi:hypothetical protein
MVVHEESTQSQVRYIAILIIQENALGPIAGRCAHYSIHPSAIENLYFSTDAEPRWLVRVHRDDVLEFEGGEVLDRNPAALRGFICRDGRRT